MERKSIESRIAGLTKDTLAQFGIMTPQHMVEHLTLTVKISYGRIKLPEFEPNEKQLAQKQALINSDIKFPIGIKAPVIGDKLLDLRYENLETAKTELVKSIDDYNQHFSEFQNDQTIHPRFGKLNYEEWERFHKKHFQHHLSQFGL
ncbi:DUF1569 domain-containing protein [Algoriphagus sp. A40]|uniref:DUF1569 domain-containing protein n=1 Tax=Algoriphagus sp. A40 TaxID=1945863 RepID=UPI0009D1FEBC|nr:DUF1569 domain-containing protein [Algoriphagus sp. A40]OOG70118.1 hypothetical protein B0E43_19590 [Algoriphagus sp. A40]